VEVGTKLAKENPAALELELVAFKLVGSFRWTPFFGPLDAL
jgi:hypothetical protein